MQHMSYSRQKMAGALFLVAATQFLLSLTIAEALYPGYSLSANYLSDLGVGPSAIIFNATVFLLGILILCGAYLQIRDPNLRVLNVMLLLMAIGAMGVGVFTEDFKYIHGAIAAFAFFFAGLSAATSAKVLEKPLSLISIVLGVITLAALGVYSAGIVTSGAVSSTEALDSVFFLGLGPGGMERMIVYPALMWLAGFGGHLVAKQKA